MEQRTEQRKHNAQTQQEQHEQHDQQSASTATEYYWRSRLPVIVFHLENALSGIRGFPRISGNRSPPTSPPAVPPTSSFFHMGLVKLLNVELRVILLLILFCGSPLSRVPPARLLTDLCA